ncbi:MAG: hypothetical protein ACRDUS_16295 [Mycobacterium sp.]
MLAQLLKYIPFYAAVVAVSFRAGWWASHYVSDRTDNFDPRIGAGKYGW